MSFQQSFWIDGRSDLMDCDSYFVFDAKEPRLEFYVGVDNGVVSSSATVFILNLETHCSS